jgi:hypothetical protein
VLDKLKLILSALLSFVNLVDLCSLLLDFDPRCLTVPIEAPKFCGVHLEGLHHRIHCSDTFELGLYGHLIRGYSWMRLKTSMVSEKMKACIGMPWCVVAKS